MPEILHDGGVGIIERLRNDINRALEESDKILLLRATQNEYPANVAEALDNYPMDVVASIFKDLLFSDVTFAAEVLVELEIDLISQMHAYLSIQEWAWVFKELSDDDVVYLLELLPEASREHLVARMPRQDKEDVMELMTYPEDSAGRIMTNEFLAVSEDLTVAALTERIRGARELDPVNLMFVYITRNDQLVGMVSLRQLLVNKKTARLKDIMSTDVSPVDVNMDQEEVAEIVRRHDEVTVPVVDEKRHVLGIITVDDVIDVIDEESEEDLYKMVGTSDEELLVGDKVTKIVGLRLPWILASFCGSLLVAFVMKVTEADVFGEDAIRIFIFVPMICAMGGNVGVQSSTIMARLLSSSHMDWKEARKSTFKEAKVGLSLGIICGLLVGIFAAWWAGVSLAVTVFSAMICAMTTAATTGTIIPIAMKRAGFDPALATGPFVTSFNDVVATCVYFGIAYLFITYQVM